MKGLETHFSLQLANVMLLRYINRYKLTHCVLSGHYTYASLQAADHCSDQQLEWEANLGLYVLRIGFNSRPNPEEFPSLTDFFSSVTDRMAEYESNYKMSCPSTREWLRHHWFDVEPQSVTLSQHQTNNGWTCPVCWDRECFMWFAERPPQ